MPDYRRYRVPGDIYFFTVNPLERRAYLPVRHIEPLREAVKCTRASDHSISTPGSCFPSPMLCVIALPPGTMLFPIALRQSKVVLYRRCRRRRGVHGYELRKVNVAFDSRPSMAASLRALRVHIRSRWICGNGVLGAYYSGRGRLCAPYGMRALQPGQTWLCAAGCALAPFDISSVGGGRCLSTVGCCRRR